LQTLPAAQQVPPAAQHVSEPAGQPTSVKVFELHWPGLMAEHEPGVVALPLQALFGGQSAEEKHWPTG
jgi:hypothetical protein